jgi:hypothetical protein
MKVRNHLRVVALLLSLALLIAGTGPLSLAQQQASVVPTLVNFSGTVTDANHKPLSGTVGLTFFLYKDQQAGSPLWIEAQNVQLDKYGHYTVMLGSTKSQGLPTDLFASGEARWLGVQVEGQVEQPRVMLLAVPYALKAGDAQTVGGLPPSAFVLAAPGSDHAPGSNGADGSNAGTTAAVTGSGTTDFIPLWSSNSILGNSILFQSGSGSTAMIGLNENSPLANLDINGSELVRGLFESATTGTATSSKGFDSNATDLEASSFNSSTNKATLQHFEWQAEPVGNNTTNPSASLNLLFNTDPNKPAETGLNIASNGKITFAAGQTFPGTGTITGVTAGTDLTGGGGSGSVTLNLDTTKVPQLAGNNSFNGNQTITGNLSDSGNITATGSVTGQTANFSANNNTQVVSVTQSGSGSSVVATLAGAPISYIPAVLGNATNTSGYGIGVQGITASQLGVGVYGINATSGDGVWGESDGANGVGVFGFADTSSPGSAVGVTGVSNASNGIGVNGYGGSTTNGIGVQGYTYGSSGIGMYGSWNGSSAIGSGSEEIAVWGDTVNGIAVLATSDNNYAVVGESTASTGVYGYSNSSTAVVGTSFNGVGMGGDSVNYSGVVGRTDGIAGVMGEFYDNSNEGAGFTNAGVWGDTGSSGSIGVLGTADDGNSLFGKNNTANHETVYAENDSSSTGAMAARFAGPGSSTYCYVVRDTFGLGDIVCTGSKSAAVAVDGNRMVRLYAVEAADNWFEDAGSAQLSNGSATVAFDHVFAQTVNGDVDYHVFITPNGECEGLYVTGKSGQGFEVHELRGGHSNIAFDYRIMARRKGFENVRMQDVTADFVNMKAESDAQNVLLEAGKQKAKARPKMQIPALPKRNPAASPRVPAHAPALPVIAHHVPIITK